MTPTRRELREALESRGPLAVENEAIAAVNFARSPALDGLTAIASAFAPVIREAVEGEHPVPMEIDHACQVLGIDLDARQVPPHIAAALVWARGEQ